MILDNGANALLYILKRHAMYGIRFIEIKPGTVQEFVLNLDVT